jgi:hypothetical protein
MNTTRETTPAVWSETDERFFRVVAEVFPTAFVWGAGELLASYDPDVETVESLGTAAQDTSKAATGLNGTSAVRA